MNELRSLVSLDLSSSEISGLPESIGNLHQLRELNLQCNNIAILPQSTERLYSLACLNISKNSIRFLPQNIQKWKHLTTLQASHNRWAQDAQCNKIQEIIQDYRHSHSLNLAVVLHMIAALINFFVR